MKKKEEEQSAKLIRCGMGLVLGGVAALAVCFVFLLVASAAISGGLAGEELMYQLTIVGCVLGAFAGGLLAVRRCGSRALIVGLTTGGVLFLLLTIGALCFETVSLEAGASACCAAPVRRSCRRNPGRRGKKKPAGKTQKIIEIGRRMCYNRSKPSLWEGNQNEACEDAQRRDSEEERRPRRLRRVPDLLPVRL